MSPFSSKRSVSDLGESDDEDRQAKRPKIEAELLLSELDVLTKPKEKKKRKKKKKKRQSVVVAVTSPRFATPVSSNASSSTVQEMISPLVSAVQRCAMPVEISLFFRRIPTKGKGKLHSRLPRHLHLSL